MHKLHKHRNYHAAVALSNGKVLVTDGDQSEVYQTAEIFDPSKQNWTHIEDMKEYRVLHQLSLLINGKVLTIFQFQTLLLQFSMMRSCMIRRQGTGQQLEVCTMNEWVIRRHC